WRACPMGGNESPARQCRPTTSCRGGVSDAQPRRTPIGVYRRSRSACPGAQSAGFVAAKRAGRPGHAQPCRRRATLRSARLKFLIQSLPNLISLARLLAVPVAVWLILGDRFASAFWLFIFAGVSDALDGFLARRLGNRSVLGAYLDPLADKALLTSVYVSL